MDIPAGRQSPEAFEAEIQRHVAARYNFTGNKYVCKECGAAIQQTTGYVSLHTNLLGSCAGGGRVQKIPLPYCPKCEGIPTKTSSCVHADGVI